MPADTPDDELTSLPPPSALPADVSDVEQEMRDAEDVALAASGLGSGLLARQLVPETAETVAVLKVCPQCGNEYETAARFCPADGTALRPKGSDSLVGRVLADRYHILKRIGEGGMGRVYLGEHVKMNRQCAIKVMSPALVNDHESAARFAREASSAARIIHPNVAAVFDYGESDGLVYLVMEYVEGEALARILAREAPLSVDRALELGRQIADGLGAAHELGIVHRDLKPDNILVARTRMGREVAKVVDFGIAKAMQENAGDALTRTGLVIGTPEFMSPEQLLGDPIDARSDLYALGCILHLMLTASPPFAATTREQMIKRRLTEEAPHVQHIDPGLPDSLDRIVMRLLARSPADRYGSAAEVRDALAGTHARRLDADGLVRAALQTPRSAPTLAFESITMAPTEVTVAAARPARPRGAMLALGVVLLVGTTLVVKSASGGGDVLAPAVRTMPPQPQPTTVVAPPVATPPPAVTARADPPKAKPVVDSAALARRAERKRKADVAQRKAEAAPTTPQLAISRYAHAIESLSVSALKAAYPNMTDKQQENWEKNVFAISTGITAAAKNLHVTPKGADKAEATFVLEMTSRSSGTSGSSNKLRQTASLVKQPSGVWQITEIH
jgi:serine/threonine-protein kinase